MNQDSASKRLIAIALIGGACFGASLLVLGITNERQGRFSDAQREIASKWGERQVIAGPMILAGDPSLAIRVLPEAVHFAIILDPEVRSRGIFKSVVYTSKVTVSGEFSADEIARKAGGRGTAVFSLPITDTRGIERQFQLSWNSATYAFEPGPGTSLGGSSGLHAPVSLNAISEKIPFSFELQLKGSEGISFAPVGNETIVSVSSPWVLPKFVGAFLPSQREVSASGFNAEWRISSFGRSYPQTWTCETVTLQQLIDSAAGVDLYQGVDMYDMIFRSVKYAILFIIVTFAVFFLFDVLTKVRVHPIQYFLIGAALALFYILLLSLAEQIGFLIAYAAATAMITILVTLYSAFVLKSKRRAVPIAAMLVALYGYLYFILQLEDYALLFSSLLLFVLLAAIMYLTRNIDWFALGEKQA